MTLNEITILANNLMNKWIPDYVSRGWSFSFMNRIKAIGLCHYGKKKIMFSKSYTHLENEEIRQVILHEIAHVLAGSMAGHGTQFIEIAKIIGCTEYGRCSKTVNVPQKTPKYVLVYNGKIVKKFYRKPKNTDFSNFYIGSKPQSKGKLIFVSYDDYLINPYAFMVAA